MHEIEKKNLPIVLAYSPDLFFFPPHKNPASRLVFESSWTACYEAKIFRRAFQKTFSHYLLDLVSEILGDSLRPLSSPFYFFPCKKKNPGRPGHFYKSVVEQHGGGLCCMLHKTLSHYYLDLVWYVHIFVNVMKKEKKNTKNKPKKQTKKNKTKAKVGALRLHQLLPQFLSLQF